MTRSFHRGTRRQRPSVARRSPADATRTRERGAGAPTAGERKDGRAEQPGPLSDDSEAKGDGVQVRGDLLGRGLRIFRREGRASIRGLRRLRRCLSPALRPATRRPRFKASPTLIYNVFCALHGRLIMQYGLYHSVYGLDRQQKGIGAFAGISSNGALRS